MKLAARIMIALVLTLLSGRATARADGDLALMRASDLLTVINQNAATTLTAYSLTTRSRFTQGLARACRGGKHVIVVLDRSPLGFAHGDNNRTQALLTSAGCRVNYSDRLFGRHQLHLKMAYSGRSMYLADTNYSIKGLVVRDDRPDDRSLAAETLTGHPGGNESFATVKGLALQIEGNVLRSARGKAIAVESESFDDGTPVSSAIEAAAAAHVPVRLIVAREEATRGTGARSEMAYLRQLAQLGVQVRLGNANEKLALVPGAAFVASANATAGIPDEVDWGLSTSQSDVVTKLNEEFQRNWNAAQPL